MSFCSMAAISVASTSVMSSSKRGLTSSAVLPACSSATMALSSPQTRRIDGVDAGRVGDVGTRARLRLDLAGHVVHEPVERHVGHLRRLVEGRHATHGAAQHRVGELAELRVVGGEILEEEGILLEQRAARWSWG